MKRQQSGFTLIELIIVIVILGILAITAAPRFFNFGSDARASTLNGLKGALETATSFTYSKAVIAGLQSQENSCFNTVSQAITACAESANQNLTYGYPKANVALITAIMDLRVAEWTISLSEDETVVLIRPTEYTPPAGTLCELQYTPPSLATAKPNIAVQSDGC